MFWHEKLHKFDQIFLIFVDIIAHFDVDDDNQKVDITKLCFESYSPCSEESSNTNMFDNNWIIKCIGTTLLK